MVFCIFRGAPWADFVWCRFVWVLCWFGLALRRCAFGRLWFGVGLFGFGLGLLWLGTPRKCGSNLLWLAGQPAGLLAASWLAASQLAGWQPAGWQPAGSRLITETVDLFMWLKFGSGELVFCVGLACWQLAGSFLIFINSAAVNSAVAQSSSGQLASRLACWQAAGHPATVGIFRRSIPLVRAREPPTCP